MFFTLFYSEALTDIFDRCDLDGNGYLSREEFDFFQMKSGGEQCDDDAWEIMKGNCQRKTYNAQVASGGKVPTKTWGWNHSHIPKVPEHPTGLPNSQPSDEPPMPGTCHT